MNILLDANVLVSVLNEEYPVYSYSARIVSLAGGSRFKVYTTPLSLAIAFYFAEKKSKRTARHKVHVLASHLNICAVEAQAFDAALRNKKIHNLEDGMQYYSALDAGCKVIVTEDKGDFYFSDIEVLSSREFLTKHVF